MRVLIYIELIIFLFGATACKKDHSGVSISSGEKGLLGSWTLSTLTVEKPGVPDEIRYYYNPFLCVMVFHKYRAPLEDNDSPIYSNTKAVDGNVDCELVTQAWKILDNGKLLLASAKDTVYAEIVFVSTDSLALKASDKNDPQIYETYGLVR